jgi:hypothetical protein
MASTGPSPARGGGQFVSECCASVFALECQQAQYRDVARLKLLRAAHCVSRSFTYKGGGVGR